MLDHPRVKRVKEIWEKNTDFWVNIVMFDISAHMEHGYKSEILENSSGDVWWDQSRSLHSSDINAFS